MKSLQDFILESKYYAQIKDGKLYLDNKEYNGYYIFISLSKDIFNKKIKEWQNSTDYVNCAQCGDTQIVFYNEDPKKMLNINFNDMFNTSEKHSVSKMDLYKDGKIQNDLFQNGNWISK